MIRIVLKNRQYSLKVLETKIDDDEEFIVFLNKNYLLFKDHLILIKGEMSDKVKTYLTQKKLYYQHDISLPAGRSRKALEDEFDLTHDKTAEEKCIAQKKELETVSVEYAMYKQETQEELFSLKKRLDTKFTVLDTIIRSGRELKIVGDLLLLNRVNSGATIHTTGNLIVTQVVEGALRCDGQFMMITVSPKANIVFNGVIVENGLLENKLNRIELKDNKIYITPVIKKEINWEQS